jgi:hypothetical protein
MNLAPLPIQKFFDNNGNPLSGGLLFTYVSGTSTKIASYTNSAGTLNTNPIVLDFRGECRLWIDPTLSYTFVLAPANDTDPPGNAFWTVDDITAGPAQQDNAADDTGPVNNIELSIPQITSPIAFTRIVFKAANTNTGPVTISINGGTAKALTWQNVAALAGGEIQEDGLYEAIYDGAQWQLQGPTLDPTQMRTAAEIAAGVIPTNFAIPSVDGVGYVLPHRYGWSTTASGTDNYTALVNAHLVAVEAAASIHLGAGSYPYKPSAELAFLVDVSGENINLTSITCDTSTFSGRMFRCTSAIKFRDFNVDLRPAIVGTGIFISDVVASSITGYMNLDRMAVYGGAKGIEIGNCFEVSINCCRIDGAAEGVWCVPDSSGGFGQVYQVAFTNCDINNNGRNVHFATPLNSYGVSFDNCAIENPTGAVGNADFQNIFTLKLTNTYGENANTISGFRFISISNLSIDTMFLLDTGEIRIDDTTTQASLKNIVTAGTNVVLNSAGTTNKISMENCQFPASGNTLGGTISYINTTINGVYYKFYGPTTGSATLTLTGCTTSPTGNMTYSVSGDQVIALVPVITGTSNSTACTLTGIPAAIRPATTQFIPVNIYTDNGVSITGVGQISSAGVFTLFNGVNGAGFTAAGTKGIGFAIKISWKLTA